MTENVREDRAIVRDQSELTAYKLVWLFVLGSFIGFVLETIFCFIVKGHLESRRGMIYGPFNQVYGFGLVVMVLLLSPLKNRRTGTVFLASAVVGGAFEFFCSWLQEQMLGTVSWDYSNDPLSILGGRTSFLFMFYWGVLGVVLIRWLYPAASGLIDRIPLQPGTALCKGLACFMAVNMIISLAAVGRWHARLRGAPASNQMEIMLDETYPNDRLAKIYPSMVAVVE